MHRLRPAKREWLELLPEEAFLLGIFRGAFGRRDRGSALPSVDGSAIRWEGVFRTALKWQVLPMLYPLLKDQPGQRTRSDIPDDTLKAMEAAYVKTCVVNQTNFSELAEIIRALAAADIQVLLLKGAHLASFVYQDMGMRWMADVDILIRRADLSKVGDVLARMRYSYPEMEPVVWDHFGKRKQVRDQAAVIDWHKNHHMHLSYFNPEGIQNLELHWAIARSPSPFSIDAEGLWERAWTEELNGVPCQVLSPEDLILHISLHDAYYHRLQVFGLRPCCDLAAVVRGCPRSIDWKALGLRARQWGVERYLGLMLALAKELIGADVPVDMLGAGGLKGSSDPVLLKAARRLMGKEIQRPAYRGVKYPGKIHVFNTEDGLFQKMGFFLKRIPISREELASRYSLPPSSRRTILCRLLRLASLAATYAPVYAGYLWQRLRYGKKHCHDFSLDLWLTSVESKAPRDNESRGAFRLRGE